MPWVICRFAATLKKAYLIYELSFLTARTETGDRLMPLKSNPIPPLASLVY